MNKRSLLIDANNLLYRVFFAQINESEDILTGMAAHGALWTMQKYYKLYPADEIVMAFDSLSWRKLYTKDLNECVTYKKYKGTRRQNLTQSQKEKMAAFDEHVQAFAEMLRTETSILVLQEKYLEADDLIAIYVQNNPDTQHVLISTDKDYIQLLGKNNLTIIDPDSGKPRSLSEWNNDPDLFMFEKCFRGDTSDNVMSSYPRLQSKKIVQAYTDEFLRENIMNHKFKVLVNSESGEIVEQEFNTRDVFEENDLLMNLYSQPEYIRNLANSSIEKSRETIGKFNYMKFVKYCGKHKLTNILERVDQFVPMLAAKPVTF
jgi:5'-3' exonuclease